MTVMARRSKFFLALGLAGATLALAIAALAPPKADAYGTFSNGVLTIPGGEGNVVPRCANDNEITVSGVAVDNGPFYCRDLRRIVARVAGLDALFDFSQLPDDLGGGQGPIEIQATSEECCDEPPGNDKFIGAANHINIFDSGLGGDSVTGGNLNDTLSGGGDGDKIDGLGGKDTIRGGLGGDKLIGGLGADSLFGGGGIDKLLGGPGRDILKGGGGNDKLVGGPGKDVEHQ
jgi:hemolysin type calcium-binding protein